MRQKKIVKQVMVLLGLLKGEELKSLHKQNVS